MIAVIYFASQNHMLTTTELHCAGHVFALARHMLSFFYSLKPLVLRAKC